MKKILLFFSIISTLLFSQNNIDQNPLYKEYFENQSNHNLSEKVDSILKQENSSEKIPALLIKADEILFKGETKEAYYYLNTAKKLIEKQKNPLPLNQYIYYYTEGAYYSYNNDYIHRLKSYVKAIKIKKENQLIDPYFLIEDGLAYHYLETDNYKKLFSISESVFNELKEQKIKYNVMKSAFFRLNSIGYRELKDYDKSQEQLDSALFYSNYYRDSTEIARITKYQADLYLDLKQYDKALNQALKAKTLYEKYDKKNIVKIYGLLGLIAYHEEDYETASHYFEYVIERSHQTRYLTTYSQTLDLYRQLLEKTHQNERAYEILKKEVLLNRQISGQKVDNQLLDIELDYKDFQNDLILKKRKERTKYIWYLFGISTIAILLLSYFLYLRFKNIKKLKRIKQKVETANENLKKVNFKLDKFSSVVSHDLKAPIRSIGSLATFIEEDEPNLSEDSIQHLGLIHKSVATAENLILNMLTLARAENNSLEKEVVIFDDIIKQIKLNLLYDLKITHTLFTIQNKPYSILGNKSLLIQLFQNFIQNSIKYRDSKRPLTIEINYIASEYKLTISDNGMGIKSENLKNLFNAYQQEKFESVAKGIGLGLYITKKIADLHDIKIELDSTEDIGTTVNLYFAENTIQ